MIGNKKYIVALGLSLFLLGGLNFSRAASFVDSYYRSDPDANPYNNYSFPGNTNPYTGKIATGSEGAYLSNYYGITASDGEGSLLKTLNPDSLRRVFIVTPQKSESEKLPGEQKTYFDKLEGEKSAVDKKLYELRQQNTIFSKCVDPTPVGCSTESNYSSKYALDGRSGLLGTEMSQTSLASCRAQIDAYQTAKTQYDQCKIDVQNEAVNSIADKAVEIARLQNESGYYQSLLTQARNSASAATTYDSRQNSCVNEHGPYSVYSPESNQCQCQAGMAPDSLAPFKCIPIEMYCKIESGIGATNRQKEYIDDVQKIVNCTCVSGYEWNESKEKCEISTPIAGKSTCLGYGVYNDITQSCVQPKYISLTEQARMKSQAQPAPSSSAPRTQISSPVAATTTIKKEVHEEALNNAPIPNTKVKDKTIIQMLKNFFLSLWR